MTRTIFLIVFLMSFAPNVAHANNNLFGSLECAFNGKPFSQQARLRFGGQIRYCSLSNDKPAWVHDGTAGNNAHCMYKDEIYSEGAIIKVSNDKSIICQTSGKWR